MKYLILIYCNPQTWEHPLFLHDPRFLALPPAERDKVVRRAEALHQEITESGELVAGVALADPRETVRVATDGPYVEAKEHLAGYFVIDCDGPDRAAAIAARIEFARVEVRPIAEGGPA